MWVFRHNVGIAFRMSAILRLPQPDSQENEIDTETKRRVWWSLYMIDSWSSAGLNLPRHLPDTAYSSVQLPMHETDFEELDGIGNDTDVMSEKPHRLGLWACMVTLVRSFPLIQDVHRAHVSNTISDLEAVNSAQNISQDLARYIDRLPPELQQTPGNLRRHAEQGLGGAFVALHLGYHHYCTLLYFQYLDTHLSHAALHAPFAARCRQHAAAFSDLLQDSGEVEGCEAVYFIVGHMTVVSSAVLLYTLLFGEQEELAVTRRRLEVNFQKLLQLRKYWPSVDMLVGSLDSVIRVSSSPSANETLLVLRWIGSSHFRACALGRQTQTRIKLTIG